MNAFAAAESIRRSAITRCGRSRDLALQGRANRNCWSGSAS